jgi:hypothetical protein
MLESRRLLETLDERFEVRAFRPGFGKKMEVVWHEDVCKNCEFKMFGVMKHLLDNARDVRLGCEERTAKGSASCQEISLVADV